MSTWEDRQRDEELGRKMAAWDEAQEEMGRTKPFVRAVPVLLSKHCDYKPGEMYAFDKGDRALLHSIHGRPSTEVIIDSGLLWHDEQMQETPGAGWVYEVIFTEYDRARVAVSARQLQWIG